MEHLLKVRKERRHPEPAETGPTPGRTGRQHRAKYSENHPDVKKLKNEIAQLTAEAQKGNPSLSRRGSGQPGADEHRHPGAAAYQSDQYLNPTPAEAAGKAGNFPAAPGGNPENRAGISWPCMRDYQNAQAKYQEVMNKLMEARISEGMEQHQKGEKFTLVDPASFPEEPIKPKKQADYAGRTVFGAGRRPGINAGAGKCSIPPLRAPRSWPGSPKPCPWELLPK